MAMLVASTWCFATDLAEAGVELVDTEMLFVPEIFLLLL